MYLSKFYFETFKENPNDADVISNALLVRASYIKKDASGIYSFLPLGYRSLRKLENIVRKNMDTIASELHLPILTDAELWIESGRYDKMGKELWRVVDRNNKNFVLGPTHEEAIVNVIRSRQLSIYDLPIHLYQIQTKIRDERRPRFGLMRGREFLMKDSYSFHSSSEEVELELAKTEKVYRNILDDLKLDYLKVEADSGAMGGASSYEFHVIADSGEDEIIYCEKCRYAANREKAIDKEIAIIPGLISDLRLVDTPNVKSIEQVSNYLNTEPSNLIKSVVYVSSTKAYLILIRGDKNINEVKLTNFLGEDIHIASKVEIDNLGLIEGFIGPYKLNKTANFKIIADTSILSLDNQIVGGNTLDKHYIGVKLSDYKHNIDNIVDLRLVFEGDNCPRCGHILKSKRGIEVGHIFNLGQKYSISLKANYKNQDGILLPYYMGCYGLGVSRLLASIIEQSHDNNGIILPRSIAPFEANIIVANDDAKKYAVKLYEKLLKLNYDVCFDDRKERFGVKMKDSDLIGIPYKIIFGRDFVNGLIEIKTRTGQSRLLDYKTFIKKPIFE